jgi:hypothetical protein
VQIVGRGGAGFLGIGEALLSDEGGPELQRAEGFGEGLHQSADLRIRI